MRTKPPDGFGELGFVAEKTIDSEFCAIGVVVDFLPPSKTRGPDHLVTFTLTDPSWPEGEGLKCRFFARNEGAIPNISSKGDVVVLRSFRLKRFNGELLGLSSFNSSWMVFRQQDIPASGTDVQEAIPVFKMSDQIPSPSQELMEYVVMLGNSVDRNALGEPPPTTSLQTSNVLSSTTVPKKFQLIQDLVLPGSNSDKKFADLLGEVRKIYMNDYRVELTISDYTYNEALYDYVHTSDDDQGRDGDDFNYNPAHKPWPGPWGKMSIVVTTWDAHGRFARDHVGLNSFVFLRNVQITLDREGARMEGNLRGDRKYPDRIGISIFKPQQAREDNRVKELLKRKRDYEASLKLHGIKGFEESEKQKKEALAVPPMEQGLSKETEKKRKKKEKRKKKAEAERKKAVAARPHMLNTSNHTLNDNIRTNGVPASITPLRICEIMDPNTLASDFPTMNGNPFALPFKNNLYQLKPIRVIDFHPPNVADFAAPHQLSDFEVLSDYESDSDMDMDRIDAPGADVTWEWRFELLIEDAGPGASSTKRTTETADQAGPARMKVLVAGPDAEFLLRDVKATDLRRDGAMLAKLKERLFLLWGDLQEQKEERRRDEGEEKGEEGGGEKVVEPSGRPFGCLVKEYGVKVQGRWERVFGMFGTSIVSD